MTDAQQSPSTTTNAPEDEMRWYVIQTYAGYENKVTRNLLNRIAQREMQHLISDVIVPTEDEIEIKNGQRRTIQRKVYPGYVLIRMKLTDDTWYLVRNTPGVSTFVGNGNKPSRSMNKKYAPSSARWKRTSQRYGSHIPLARPSKSSMGPSPTSKVWLTPSTKTADGCAYWFHFLVVKPESISTSCR